MKYKKIQILNNIHTDIDLACSILKKYINKGLYMYDSIKSRYFKIKDVDRYDKYLVFRCIKYNYSNSSSRGSIYSIPLKYIINGSTVFVIEKR